MKWVNQKKLVQMDYLKILYPNYKFLCFENEINNTIEWFKNNYENLRK